MHGMVGRDYRTPVTNGWAFSLAARDTYHGPVTPTVPRITLEVARAI
jgi:hypothetical protein